MTVEDLKEEISIELEFMETVVHELLSMKKISRTQETPDLQSSIFVNFSGRACYD